MTIDQVNTLVTEHAATRPLTTAEITEYCQSRYPDYPGITTQRVSLLLKWLLRRNRVVTWAGRDAEALAERGVSEPRQRMRYWALAPQERR